MTNPSVIGPSTEYRADPYLPALYTVLCGLSISGNYNMDVELSIMNNKCNTSTWWFNKQGSFCGGFIASREEIVPLSILDEPGAIRYTFGWMEDGQVILMLSWLELEDGLETMYLHWWEPGHWSRTPSRVDRHNQSSGINSIQRGCGIWIICCMGVVLMTWLL